MTTTSNGHARFAPSSANIWLNCHGQTGLVASLVAQGKVDPNETNQYAAWGTAAHEIAAECLLDDREAFEFAGDTVEADGYSFVVDNDMVDCVQKYVDYVRTRVESEPSELFIEKKVWLNEECGGTADALIWFPESKALEIVDLKTGFGIVEPDSPQLKIYGEGGRHLFPNTETGKGPTPEHIVTTIVQPRAPHIRGPVRSAFWLDADLGLWSVGTVEPAIRAGSEPNAPLTAGAHCKYCPAKDFCSTYQDKVKSSMAQATGHPDVDEMTPEELAEFKDQWPQIQDFASKVDARIFHLQMAGVDVPGQKLVKSLTRRAWLPQAAAEAPARLGVDVWEKPKLKSPAAMEKLGKKAKAFVAEFAVKPEGKLISVSADDNRPAVSPEPRDLNATFGHLLTETEGN